MRNNIVHIGAGELTYEIRAIVEIAECVRVSELGCGLYESFVRCHCHHRFTTATERPASRGGGS